MKESLKEIRDFERLNLAGNLQNINTAFEAALRLATGEGQYLKEDCEAITAVLNAYQTLIVDISNAVE